MTEPFDPVPEDLLVAYAREAQKRIDGSVGDPSMIVSAGALASLCAEVAVRRATTRSACLYYAQDDTGRVFLIGGVDADDARERFAQVAGETYRGTSLRRVGFGFLGAMTFNPHEASPFAKRTWLMSGPRGGGAAYATEIGFETSEDAMNAQAYIARIRRNNRADENPELQREREHGTGE